MILFSLALLVGLIVGLLPGFGLLSAAVLLYPFLITLTPIEILTFYAVMAGASQFTGSIVASSLGVAGESSSIPACREGPGLFVKGQGALALSTAAIGSFFSTAVVAAALFYAIMYLSDAVAAFYNNNLQTVIFVTVFAVMVLSGINRPAVNLLYALLGIFLANVGLQRYYLEPMTFGIPALSTGIPFVALAVGLYAVPQVIESFSNIKGRADLGSIKIASWTRSWSAVFQHRATVVRSTVIGFFSGLVPGLTTILASNLSYSVEKYLRSRKSLYEKDGDMPSLLAAETANNGASLMSVVPLMLMGIPIMGSEVVILNAIEKTGLSVGFGTLNEPGMFATVASYVLLGSMISMLLAWYGARYLMMIYRIRKQYLIAMLLAVSVVAVISSGMINNDLITSLCLFLVFLFFGYILRRTDTSVVLFSFLIYPYLEGSVVRFVAINF
jgi:putative tricarboxylic transport membrane protein